MTGTPIGRILPPCVLAIGLTGCVHFRGPEGLRRTVADPLGTAYDGDSQPAVSWAGKTGTAETGTDNQEHAWFAAYAPADQPRVALVVVLEHAGNASETAVPVAKRLVAEILAKE